MTTTKIVMWNQEDYKSREAAMVDGAITEHVIPSFVKPCDVHSYIGTFINGAVAASKRFKGEDLVNYEAVELTSFSVSVEVLEWNRYTFTIEAETEDEARFKALDENVGLSYDDVETGVTGSSFAAPRNVEIN